MSNIKNSFEYSFYVFFTLLTIIFASAIFYLTNQKIDRMKSYNSQNLEKLEVAYIASIDKFHFYANRAFTLAVLKPNILEELYNATKASSEKEKRFNKALLFKDLSPVYEILKKDGIRQFHFHLADNTSFLRFHNLVKFGDNLSSYRPSVVYVNANKIPLSVFETGRLISGFRNVYPITYKDTHLGSVEISASLKSITDSMKTLLKDNEFKFILNGELVDYKLFDTQKHLYSASTINPDFVLEDIKALLPDSPTPLSSNAKEINKILSLDSDIKKQMNKHEKFAKLVSLNHNYYDVLFLPMLGLDNRLEGYLVSYSKANNLPPIIDLLPWSIGTVTIGYFFLVFLLLLLKKRSQEINEQKNWITQINDSLGDGLYVMDTHANILYVNPTACKLLGYSKEELLGKSAHYTFHSHFFNDNLPLEECPILEQVKEFGYADSINESFITKDGTEIWVEVSSRALFRDEEIHLIVTTFKDVTIRRDLENRMKLLTKALESSANAVVITDKDAFIEWANPAFEHLTGFKITEVLGKQPKEFINSGKQSKSFYEDMWNTILSKKSWSGEIINKKKDGTFYYEELSITPVLNAHREIQNFIAIKQDISDRKEREKNIEYFAYYDHLTNLPNRRLFSEHLSQLLKSQQRDHKISALLFLDLDKFKLLNDTYGHDIGDELLREVAARLQNSVRAKDIVARLGGDEFVIILENLGKDFDEAENLSQIIANKLLETIRKEFRLKSLQYHTSTSIGIYIFAQESDIENVLKKADIALYEAKAKGRNGYFIYKD